MPTYKLTYFPLKARGEPIRLAFHYGGIDFIDERINHSLDEFVKLKESFPFGQLPILTIDDQTVIAQETAILRYVGHLAGLYPTDPLEAAKVDMAIGCVDDCYQLLLPSFLEKDEARKANLRKTAAEESLPKWLGYLDRLLTSNKSGYSAGSTLSVADLRIYGILWWLKSGLLDGIPSQLVDKYSNVTKLYKMVDSNEKVASWNAAHAKSG